MNQDKGQTRLPPVCRTDRARQGVKDKGAGFTMMELLIVIAILGGLGAIFMSTYPSSQRRARDARRMSDLKQYQVELEKYANSNGGFFPGRMGASVYASDSTPPPPNLCADLGLSGCPADPKDGEGACDTGQCRYYFQSNTCNNGTACATRYTLRARLEQESGHWVICSNGKSGLVPESTTFSNGTCPGSL